MSRARGQTVQQAMNGTGASKTTIRFLTTAAAIAALSACQPGAGGGGSDATRAASVGNSVQLIERDVEAPEVFKANESALWDGRPSLGGVWVAAPGVKDPERIIIRNEANGKFVIGALFKRERSNPGPALQLSSDAATALGIIAGKPTVIDVVALRREEVPDPAAAPVTSAPEAVADAPEAIAEEEIVRTADLPRAQAAAPAPQAERPDAIAAAVAAVDGLETGGETAGAASETVAAAAPETQTQPRGNWFQRTFGRKQAEAPAPLPASAPAADAAPLASSAAAPAIAATSLDAPAQTAAAPRATPPRNTGGLERAYVQIGIFSVEQNARNTATALSQAGVLPTVLEQESRGRKFWRVIVGPATTASDRAAVIRKAKGLGFTDAYAVRG
ncbi:SPOR domain-containing protein [Jannaschia sp. M317]|uniref:SPOR domain-containing protein n=1 Tax=Jannaschia sp. M317 TaxID=2867011 RepID=UPI0021A28E8D|nr:SPOR domain-containing protein [Jannaschia sp. M317]UWQ16929.1 SPOR domain-containing protein [Jannaschia sp. M317]